VGTLSPAEKAEPMLINLALVALTSLALITPGTAQVSAPSIQWRSCDGMECATVPVPLDYRNPGGRRISLAISRLRSPDPAARRGVLLVIPGGPGGSSLTTPAGLAAKLPQPVRDAYDLVGFDPRGVGQSAPVSCGLEHADLAAANQRPWPAPDGSIGRNVATARRIARACLTNGDDVLRSISTANEARDIDRVRQALGESKLSAWGTSYGTYAGAVYATMFPGRTDRIVLDSNDDPDPTRVARGWLANTSIAVEDRFPDFAAWAADPGNPDRLAGTPEGVRRGFLDLAARLDRAPIPWPGANPPELSGNVLRETLQESLYSDARFPALAALILAGRGERPLPAPSSPPDAVLQNVTAVAVSTICDDVAWPRSIPAIARDVAADRARYPLTAGMPVNIGPCGFWPAPEEPPVRVTSHGPSNILLAQNLRDPATPYKGALRMRQALGDRARMVSVDSGGHDVYLANGNACGDAVVSRFLATGERPAHDVLCR
jgi:pimeloyl-ACP methyl ester carboxylesterase